MIKQEMQLLIKNFKSYTMKQPEESTSKKLKCNQKKINIHLHQS